MLPVLKPLLLQAQTRPKSPEQTVSWQEGTAGTPVDGPQVNSSLRQTLHAPPLIIPVLVNMLIDMRLMSMAEVV